ncbi:MAG: hypothetical protein L6Q99_01085 [Planctomycetes bacterium]|nr:hypothetical protein [Planctomycetota bacterium]
MSIEHWMFFGTFAQKDFFEYPQQGTYAGVILNANMVAHAPGGLAAFLQEKRAGGKYLIDPLTHAFQHDPSVISDGEGETKSSIRSLAEHYGDPILSLAGKRPLRPKDLAGGALSDVVKNCVAFQREYLPANMKETDAAKYLEDQATQEPYAVVAPYFFLTEATVDHWLPLCVDSVRLTRAAVPPDGPRVFGSVVVSQGVVTDRVAREKVAQAFASTSADGFLLWVDNLDEQSAGGSELAGLMALAHALRSRSREVINIHGGYFSVLVAGAAGGNGMSGVAHGPEFGEFRSVVPVGGGIPIARYYVPKLHARVRYRDALRMFREKGWLETADVFHESVCNCSECQSTLGGDPGRFTLFGEGNAKSVRRRQGIVRIEFPTREASQRCLKHYLQWKRREYVQAAIAPKDKLLLELVEGAQLFEDVAGLDGVAHLRLWETVLKG